MAPNRSNNYQLPSWPPTAINRDLWNAVLLDIALRLTARENLEASFEELTEQGIQAALDYIQANVGPQLAALQAAVSAAQEAIEDVLEGTAPNAVKLGGQLPSFYATAAALALKLDSANFEAFVAALTGNAPEGLNTIHELAAAIGNDPNIRQTLLDAIALKFNKAGGTLTGNAFLEAANPLIGLKQTAGPNAGGQGYIHNNGVNIGFVDSTAQVLLMVNLLTGAVQTKQFPDLKTALDAKAPLTSPAFAGNPTVPNQLVTDSSTKAANTATVDAKIAANSPQLFTAETSIAVNTTQQNLTGKPMAVSISRTASVNDSSGATLTATIQAGEASGSLSARVANTAYGPSGAVISSSAAYNVPAGAYYRLTTSNSGGVTTGTTVAYSVN